MGVSVSKQFGYRVQSVIFYSKKIELSKLGELVRTYIELLWQKYIILILKYGNVT